MILRPTLLLLLLLDLCFEIIAQDNVKGKIYEAETDSTIAGVNVYNLNARTSVRSGKDGSYTIPAEEGDRIIFSIIGFKPDTAIVSYSMLLVLHDVTLSKKVVILKNVTVTSSYRLDSTARRNYYSDIFGKQPGITGRNTPSNGVGISLSPLSYFSYRAKQKRQLKKRLLKQEEELYVDRMFTKEWVARVTGLQGDSLARFMMLYRPSYEFCRKYGRDKMLLYVNEKLKEFKKINNSSSQGTAKLFLEIYKEQHILS